MNNLSGAAPGWSSDGTPNLIRGFHCIGPQALVTTQGVYLTFGSFQHGIAQVEIDPSTGGVLSGSAVTPIATRRILSDNEPDADLALNALEGGYIRQHGSHYYFFVSYDYCCKATQSTYWLIVGRSTSPQGPFVDRLGRDLWSTVESPGPNDPQFTAGSAAFIATDENVIGPGSMALIEGPDGCSVMVHHYYDGSRGGAVTLMARPVEWVDVTEGAITGPWPRAMEPIGYAPPSSLPTQGPASGEADCLGTLPAVPSSNSRSAALPMSDPALEKVGTQWYAFSTAPGVQYSTSTDLATWDFCGRVYETDVPAWVAAQGLCAGTTAGMWAPDISFFGGLYHCYYTVAAFGCPQAAIGHASCSAIPANPVGAGATTPACPTSSSWTDHGAIVQSSDDGTSTTPFRAIDPNVLVVTAPDGTEQAFLTFGSYRSGIYQVPLDPSTGEVARGATPQLIATRGFSADPSLNLNAMEGSFLLATTDSQGTPLYALFCTFDNCCFGVDTTYYLVAGASHSPSGPFNDIAGVPMLHGGATALLGSTGNMIGPGSIDIALDPVTGCLVAAYSYVDGTCEPPSSCIGLGYTLGTRQLCLLNVDESNYAHTSWPRLGPVLGYSPLPRAAECLPGRSPDINQDGVVDGIDLAMLINSWGGPPLTPEQTRSDLNRDGIVDGADLSLVLEAWTPVA